MCIPFAISDQWKTEHQGDVNPSVDAPNTHDNLAVRGFFSALIRARNSRQVTKPFNPVSFSLLKTLHSCNQTLHMGIIGEDR
eukprot:c10130_g1_i1 orf=83-328(+)